MTSVNWNSVLNVIFGLILTISGAMWINTSVAGTFWNNMIGILFVVAGIILLYGGITHWTYHADTDKRMVEED
ncbi:MAG: hypothetical protein Sylvanvirus9_7 [Sylvanvirus sp.]|uniref:Uncharacterized protein n=1 Tax=Sylvanvirus sp. TaxID=2487774 RepID=A0A3G5AHU9_9VIRU|nr:MAG: hypothetical protein Sylvanvirus9_7 [Sylvanvirus sp.]